MPLNRSSTKKHLPIGALLIGFFVASPMLLTAAPVVITSQSGTTTYAPPNAVATKANWFDGNINTNAYFYGNQLPLAILPDRLYDLTSYNYRENTDRSIDESRLSYGGNQSVTALPGVANHEAISPSLSGRGGMILWDFTTGAANSGGTILEVYGTATNYLKIANPTITASAATFTGSNVNNVFNGSLGSALTDQWVSNGQGSNAFIDFDFGASIRLDYFEVVQRGTTNDLITGYDIILSNNSDFSSPIATVSASLSGPSAWTSLLNLGGVTARYVRWDVTSNTSGSNTGAREIAFYAIPEPSSLGLLTVGLVALLLRRRSRA